MNDFNVLLIEDVAQDREVATRYLTNMGAVTNHATTAFEAIIKMNTTACDIVLTSLDSEQEGVIEAIACLRADPRLALIPVIGMSVSLVTTSTTYPSAMLDDVLAKPLGELRFRAFMRRWQEKITGFSNANDPPRWVGREIDRLDIDGALERLRGNVTLYVKVLHWFEHEQRGLFSRLWTAVDTGDFTSALKLLHDSKSLAGTIGANGLFDYLVELEMAIRAGLRERIQFTLTGMQQVVQSTLELVMRYLALQSATPST